MDAPPVLGFDELAARVTALCSGGGRRLVGLTGPPGVGKSTTAARMAERLDARVLPMDGFHLAQSVLDAAGTADRKGAPHTFDGVGFAHLLARLRVEDGEVVHAPRFDRHLEEPIAGAIPIGPSDDLVLVEGNYLLLDAEPWSTARAHLDLVVHLHLDPAVRVERLVARHVEHGRSPAEARRWVERSDEVNARLVDAVRDRADLVLDVGSESAD